MSSPSLHRCMGGAARATMAVLLVLLLCLIAAPTFTTALTTAVDAGEKFTVTENLPIGTELHFQFALHPDYLMPISITDRATNEVLMSWKDRSRGVFSLPASAKPRVLVVTFDNTATMFSLKNVNFDLRTPLNAGFAVSAAELDPIEQKMRVLSATMQRLKTLQLTMRSQQKDHRATIEDANERVLLYSVFQVVAFLTMTGSQLFLLRRFLEKKTYI